MQDKLRDQLGTPIVIENKPQVGGTAGTAEVAQSAPDGHTWVMSFNGPWLLHRTCTRACRMHPCAI
jgi:tripartite-type tricarboxylate transporter receptor subunit TctC